MCLPVIVGAATAATSYAGQKAAADAQEKAQAEASAAEQIRAGKANTAVRLRQAQENMARAQRKEAAQIKGMDAKSKTKLIALTEGGVAGRTLDMLVQDLTAEEARYEFSEDRQKDLQATQAGLRLEEEASRTRMNQLRINQPIRQASIVQAGLQGLQAGMGMAQATQGLKVPNPLKKALGGDIPQAVPYTPPSLGGIDMTPTFFDQTRAGGTLLPRA